MITCFRILPGLLLVSTYLLGASLQHGLGARCASGARGSQHRRGQPHHVDEPTATTRPLGIRAKGREAQLNRWAATRIRKHATARSRLKAGGL